MDYFEGYLESLVLDGNYSKNTIEAYAGDVHRFSDFLQRRLPKDQLPDLVTPNLILEFLNEESRDGFSVTTLQRRKMALAHFAQYLSSLQVFAEEGIREIMAWQRNNWSAIYSQKVDLLTAQEVNRLLKDPGLAISAIKKRDLAIVAIMLDAALQVGQVVNLKVSELEYREGYWHLYGYRLVKGSPALTSYYQESRPEFAPSKTEDILFLSLRGGPISRQGIWQIVKEYAEDCGIKRAVSPTTLRYSAVFRMMGEGVTTIELQKRLGHTNISSTRALVRKIKRTIR